MGENIQRKWRRKLPSQNIQWHPVAQSLKR